MEALALLQFLHLAVQVVQGAERLLGYVLTKFCGIHINVEELAEHIFMKHAKLS